MSVEMKIDHLSQRERYIMSLVYASISSLSDEAYAIANVNHIVSYADRLEPVERAGGGVDVDDAMVERALLSKWDDFDWLYTALCICGLDRSEKTSVIRAALTAALSYRADADSAGGA